MSNPHPKRSGNPAKRAAAGSATPRAGTSPLNDRSRAILVRMAKLPPFVVPGLMLVFMLAGLTAPLAVALPALAVVLIFIGWLALLSWPVLTARGRLVRALMLGLVLGSAVARVAGYL